jgi:hypothetical protein
MFGESGLMTRLRPVSVIKSSDAAFPCGMFTLQQ